MIEVVGFSDLICVLLKVVVMRMYGEFFLFEFVEEVIFVSVVVVIWFGLFLMIKLIESGLFEFCVVFSR